MILWDQNNGSFSVTRNQKQYLAQANDKKQKISVNIIQDEDRNIVDTVINNDQISKSTYIMLNITQDFFGLLKHRTLPDRKAMVLETYKLIFRFSIGKLI